MSIEPVNGLARWLPCACLKYVSRLRSLEKTLNFFRCIHFIVLVLKYGSDINERNWLQLLFYFIVLMGMVDFVVGMRFLSCVSGFILKFSRIAFWRKRLHLDSKNDLTRNVFYWFSGFFCWKMASFVNFISVWTEICKNCSIFILFWRHQVFPMFSLRGILVCFLKMLVLFSHRILQYRLISFRNAM